LYEISFTLLIESPLVYYLPSYLAASVRNLFSVPVWNKVRKRTGSKSGDSIWIFGTTSSRLKGGSIFVPFFFKNSANSAGLLSFLLNTLLSKFFVTEVYLFLFERTVLLLIEASSSSSSNADANGS